MAGKKSENDKQPFEGLGGTDNATPKEKRGRPIKGKMFQNPTGKKSAQTKKDSDNQSDDEAEVEIIESQEEENKDVVLDPIEQHIYQSQEEVEVAAKLARPQAEEYIFTQHLQYNKFTQIRKTLLQQPHLAIVFKSPECTRYLIRTFQNYRARHKPNSTFNNLILNETKPKQVNEIIANELDEIDEELLEQRMDLETTNAFIRNQLIPQNLMVQDQFKHFEKNQNALKSQLDAIIAGDLWINQRQLNSDPIDIVHTEPSMNFREEFETYKQSQNSLVQKVNKMDSEMFGLPNVIDSIGSLKITNESNAKAIISLRSDYLDMPLLGKRVDKLETQTFDMSSKIQKIENEPSINNSEDHKELQQKLNTANEQIKENTEAINGFSLKNKEQIDEIIKINSSITEHFALISKNKQENLQKFEEIDSKFTTMINNSITKESLKDEFQKFKEEMKVLFYKSSRNEEFSQKSESQQQTHQNVEQYLKKQQVNASNQHLDDPLEDNKTRNPTSINGDGYQGKNRTQQIMSAANKGQQQDSKKSVIGNGFQSQFIPSFRHNN